MRLALICLAVCVYAAAAGCALYTAHAAAPAVVDRAAEPASSPRRDLTALLPLRCVGMQIQRVDWMDKYKQSVDEIAALGAGGVKFVVDARQEDGNSNRIYLDLRLTPSAEGLADLIRYAKGKGLKVVLMPIVLLDDPKGDEWRGTIKPQSWHKWFDSYRDILGHFAWIAEGNGVDLFVVGSELVSTEREADEWADTIRFVRSRFSGLITYSSNWDHYQNIPFWDKLDLIGMNSYWKLGDDKDAGVDEIKEHWREIQAQLKPFIEKKGKPLMFMEIGWCSLDNAAKEPWDYTQPLPANPQLQKRLYEGFFETWSGTPWLGGFSVWEWTPGDGGAKDKGYTPENKPAEKVLKEYLAKPRWDVAL